jgi:hypothetical protein
MCTFVIAVATDTCTATVGDLTGSARPTGTVSFSSAAGGVFTLATAAPSPGSRETLAWGHARSSSFPQEPGLSGQRSP